MKVRKLAVALALAGGLGSGVAQALGLGEIELQSYLNEPLEADINLRKSQGVDPDDVFVNIASEGDYQRVGIDRNYFLTKLKFEVTTSNDGNLIVNVSSREPLREPYLNFLLEVTWPSGRLMREYSVLVDPPVYAEESGIQEQVSAPATRQPATSETTQPTGQRQSEGGSTSSTAAGLRTLGPTNSSDTLWKIAQSVKPNDSVSTQQVMLAIQDLNSDAFMDGNINRLKRGEVLRIPDLEQIRSRSRGEANRQVAMQNEALSSQTRTVDATESRSSDGAAPDATGAGEDELRLIAADDSASRDSEDGGSAGGDGQTAGGADAGSAVAMEELESARRENQELNSRVEDLQDQVETLQRLLELKDSQLAEMQQMGGEDEPSAAAQPDDEVGPGEDSMAAGDEVAGQGEQEQLGSEDQEVAGDSPGTALGESADTASAEGEETGEDVAEANGDGAPAGGDEPVEDDMAAADDTGLSGPDGPGAEAGVDDSSPGTQSSVSEPDTTEEAATQPAAPAQQPDKGFPANVVDAITSNPLYQIALGGGLILLLLLLLLLARRNANREKAFYEQLNGEEGEGSDTFDLSLEDEESADTAGGDPLAEAETYIAYGQMDKAAQSLETAISREPSRTDIRLKLLGVYADNQDRDSFDKQFREIEALEDDSAIAEAGALRERLEEAESMPSIDDLESQLRSDSFGREEESTSGEEPAASSESNEHLADETLSDQAESGQSESSADELEQLDTDFSDLELAEEPEAEQKSEPEAESDSGTIEYDLSGIEEFGEEEASAVESAEEDDDLSFDFEDSALEAESDTASGEASDDLSDELSLEDFDSLEGDLATDESVEKADEAPSFEQPEEDSAPEGEGLGDLDESFLDELDAELDKVADESGGESLAGEESGMDDLELDVSDEDLALMEEFADSGDTDTPETEKPAPALDEELDLEDSLMDNTDDTPEEFPDLGETDELSADGSESAEEADVEPPVASDSLDADSRKSTVEDLDESDLGDDDDFDFLAGTDEAATKLDLARAYIEMGDVDGARDILEEVSLEGSDEQKTEAQDLLKNLS